MPSEFEYKKISLTDLLVNPENPRFRAVNHQREAIEQLLIDQDDKLVRLAEDIIEYGINPSEMTIVTPDAGNSSKFIVEEGNRRVTTLKLLHNQDIADERFKFIHSTRFRNLAKEFAKSPVNELYCVVYPTKQDTTHWVQLKHTGNNRGVGVENWDAQQTARYAGAQTGRNSEALQALDFLAASSTFPSELKTRLPEVNSSTLDRLLGTKATKEFLGVKLIKGVLHSYIVPEEVERGLKKIVTDILSGLSARDLDTKSHREEYIWSFSEEDVPDQSKATENDWPLNSPQDAVPVSSEESSSEQSGANETPKDNSESTGPNTESTDTTPPKPEENKPKSPKSNRLSTDRETLLPRKFVANIQNNRANKIYRELKKLNVNDFENAAGVLFRVFVEVSTDIYIETQSLTAIHKNSKLRQKVEAVAKHMEANGFSDQYKLKGIRTAISNDHSILSIHTFNAIVHNPDYSPDALSLKKAWDNIEPYMEALWQHA